MSNQKGNVALYAIPVALALAILIGMAIIFNVSPPCSGKYRFVIGGEEYLLFECDAPAPTLIKQEKNGPEAKPSIQGEWITKSNCDLFCGGDARIVKFDKLYKVSKTYDGEDVFDRPAERCRRKLGEEKRYENVFFENNVLSYTDGDGIWKYTLTWDGVSVISGSAISDEKKCTYRLIKKS